MKKLIFLVILIPFLFSGILLAGPGGVDDDLVLWLDAGDGVTYPEGVMTWQDKSGQNNHALQATPANRPLWVNNILEGKPVIRFDGSSSYLEIAADVLAEGNDITILSVLNKNDTSLDRRWISAAEDSAEFWPVWSLQITGGGNLRFFLYTGDTPHALVGSTGIVDDEFFLFSSRYSSTDDVWDMHLNGFLEDEDDKTGDLDRITLGTDIGFYRHAQTYWDGDIAEIIIYDRALSTEDQQKIEGYLAHKYGLENELPEGHPYKDFPPEPLPVELSSFTAIVTADMFVRLQWTAETETNLLGYNVYRNTENNLNDAFKCNPSIIEAHNSSTTVDYYFLDTDVLPGEHYYYWLQSVDLDLTHAFHGPISIQVDESGEGQGTTPPPLRTELIGAYPNPFNPATSIAFSLDEAAQVRITVFNVSGQLVQVVTDQYYNKPGHYTEIWDGRDSRGQQAGSGVYFYQMEVKGYDPMVKRMLLLK